MKIQNITMTVTDHARLDRVIAFAGEVFNRARGEWQGRESELERAQIPANVITLTSYAVHQIE
jgi:hypothetical protein